MSNDVKLAAQSSATVVILMGMSKLPEITQLFRESGKKDIPVAIIQNGTTLEERVAVGTIDSIQEEVEKLKLSNPAIIVIGEVVRNRAQLLNLQVELAQTS